MKLTFKSPTFTPTLSRRAPAGSRPTNCLIEVNWAYEQGDNISRNDWITLSVKGAPKGTSGLAAAHISSNFTYAYTWGAQSGTAKINAPIVDWADGAIKSYEVIARAYADDGFEEMAESADSALIALWTGGIGGAGTPFVGRPSAHGTGPLYESE